MFWSVFSVLCCVQVFFFKLSSFIQRTNMNMTPLWLWRHFNTYKERLRVLLWFSRRCSSYIYWLTLHLLSETTQIVTTTRWKMAETINRWWSNTFTSTSIYDFLINLPNPGPSWQKVNSASFLIIVNETGSEDVSALSPVCRCWCGFLSYCTETSPASWPRCSRIESAWMTASV